MGPITVVQGVHGVHGETHVEMYKGTIRYAYGTVYPPARVANMRR